MRKQKWLKRVSERILPNKPEGILRYKSEGNSVISRNISCDISRKVNLCDKAEGKFCTKSEHITYKKKRILRYRRNGYIQVQMKKELQITAPFVDLNIDLIRPIRSRQLRHRRHDAGREDRCGYNRRPDRSLPCAVHTWVRAR